MKIDIKKSLIYISIVLMLLFTVTFSTSCATGSKSSKAVNAYNCKPSRHATNPIYFTPVKRKSRSKKAIETKSYPPPKDFRIRRSGKKYLYPKR